ncbi:Aldehyde dehydrogenase B [Meiothermus luteus]|jgi:aldehyde dehydrogenase (NAD+)|uniref:Aldehyde dehydrogenase B n=1 Tax=Meiothermus luteus TaxID=2026184 RepID=A0A399F067_9DEIN|nr:aldehyde dehydrogenase family protein [Meiothermus luteus]RIH89360.1 Aldehyde dehydrogenase B [Meiothermus luteus]RMH53930.1 MAG: aldehyde dehydrogenase family protein [Deinococcota bacterium]
MTVAEIMQTLEYGPAPEAAEPALDWLRSHRNRFGLFIGGRWRAPKSGTWFATLNPADGRELAQVAQAGREDVELAVRAARRAFAAWGKTPGHLRARYLYALARQIQKHARLFAVLETLDNGKPIRETRDIDIPLVVRHFYYHAGWAQLMDSELSGYEPLGVVGQIIPWNFPLLMLAWKVAPALAMGNTVVLKPAEFTPLTALLFAEICVRVGLPAGVVNILTGDGRTGAALVEHPGVDKIAFTGSTEVGRLIRRATAGSGKRLSLELGGKSPFIVFEDADLDSAVEGVVDAIWFNQGQVCCAGSRLLVQEGIADGFYQKLKARMEKLRVGNPLDKAVDIGAIIAPVQLEKIKRLVQRGLEEGAELWQPSWAVPKEGCFYPPTLFTNVAPSATIAQEEIFGPVLAALTFRTPEEAVRLANNTRYGLAASVWSEDINLALDVATQIKAGTVWINSTNLFDAASGFGGYRESGFGREGGKEGLWEYVRRVRPRTPLARKKASPARPQRPEALPPIDRTAKLFIGGRQVRPDSGYSRLVYGPDGGLLGEVALGNRKDIRNAVEAARGGFEAWRRASAHHRAQILYFLAENLSERAAEFAYRIAQQTGQEGREEVEAAIEALFSAAAWADKYEGVVHPTPYRNVTLAIPEPVGVLGILCPDDWPLLALARLAGTALALGNALVVVPSPQAPLTATDFYQVLETSDVPAGVFNLITGERDELAQTLAEHDDVDAVWYAGPQEGQAMVERSSAGNMKRTWTLPQTGPLPEVEEVLRQATQVKNIWVPYGA